MRDKLDLRAIEVRRLNGPKPCQLGQLGYGVPFTLFDPREPQEEGILFLVDSAFLSGGATIQKNGLLIAASLGGTLHSFSFERFVIPRTVIAQET